MLKTGWRDAKTQEIYNKKEKKAMLTTRGRAIRPTPTQMLNCSEDFVSQS